APVLAGYVAVTWWQQHDWRVPGRAALALAVGAALSAFYWLPVLLESHYVGLGSGASAGYRNHLMPLANLVSSSLAYDYTLPATGLVTFALGWPQALILAAGLLALPLYRHGRLWLSLFVAAGLFSALMLSQAFLPVWQILERGLAFLQYPWRFHAIGVMATAIVAGMLVEAVAARSKRLAILFGALLLLVVAASSLWGLPVRDIEPDASVEAMWDADRAYGQVGATWTGEYLPVWVEEERWAISHSAAGEAESGDGSGAAVGAGSQQLLDVGYTRCRLEVDVSAPTTLILHQFYYPGWRAEWQDETITARPTGDLGLAAFDLPPGSGRLVLRLASTPAQKWGTLASLAVALGLAIALVAGMQSHPRTGHRPVYTVSAVGCLLLAALLLGSLLMPNGHLDEVGQVGANLEDTVELLAFRLGQDGDYVYHPGDSLDVTLYWRALRALSQDYKVSVQITDAAVTRQPAQHDGDPGGGFTPTSRWLAGEIVPDGHVLALPADLAPGRYRLWAAMYEYPAVRNLEVRSSETETDGMRLMLAEIEVAAP
ncbi:MAG: hypothetical protein ACK2U9_01355, partial [Anaerolineae bacterium]